MTSLRHRNSGNTHREKVTCPESWRHTIFISDVLFIVLPCVMLRFDPCTHTIQPANDPFTVWSDQIQSQQNFICPRATQMSKDLTGFMSPVPTRCLVWCILTRITTVYYVLFTSNERFHFNKVHRVETVVAEGRSDERRKWEKEETVHTFFISYWVRIA